MRARGKNSAQLEIAKKHLAEWQEAELEVTTHQSYRLGNEMLTMADLDAIGRRIDYWSAKVAELQRGGRTRFYRAVPNDS